jgi:3-hydroxyacyl-CoA dehydrogenase
MVDTNDAALQKGKQTIISSLTRIAKKKYEADVTAQKSYIDDIMSRVQLTTDASNAASHADLIVEAIVENLEIKKSLFSTIAKVAPSHCIMTSNTSSLKVTDIATSCPERKNYFAGLHFFNPVPQMKLVEVISTSETDPKTIQKLVEFCKSVGKSPVMCKDTPG